MECYQELEVALVLKIKELIQTYGGEWYALRPCVCTVYRGVFYAKLANETVKACISYYTTLKHTHHMSCRSLSNLQFVNASALHLIVGCR